MPTPLVDFGIFFLSPGASNVRSGARSGFAFAVGQPPGWTLTISVTAAEVIDARLTTPMFLPLLLRL
jgi:hypothetical protein